MPGRAKMTLLACVCAGAIAGCGGSDESTQIPAEQADSLLARLAELEEQVAAGDCSSEDDGAEAQAAEIGRIINDELPADFDSETQEGLSEAADNLMQLTIAECVEGQGTDSPDRDRSTTETETEPTTTTTTTTEPTTTEPTTTETDEEEPPSNGGSDNPGGGPTGGGPTGGGGNQPDVDIEPPDVEPPSGGVGGERGTP